MRLTPKTIAAMEDVADACQPFVHETQHCKSLHFSWMDVQSRMLKREPDRLILDYTRTMMGFLLFNRRPDRIAILGLGGGSLAKSCYRELPLSRIDVVEINAQVVALRDEFHVPRNDERFQVHLVDGGYFIKQSPRQLDVLLVDAYTREGIATELASQVFFNRCRYALADNGIMVVNVYCGDADALVDRIRRSFGGAVFTVDERDKRNRVVFACAGDTFHRQQPNAFVALGSLSPASRAMLTPAFSRIVSAMREQCETGLPVPA